ncbi:MAG: chemotaxis protein CheA [Planctomycetes bacterium]|jgi:two-component system chemotaxis sensor kinase CheA|nr:chemotaxis protein CheA [Planctomycetota bacterium]
MTIASGTESLGSSIQRLQQEGRAAASTVVQQLRQVERQAAQDGCEPLQRRCREAAEALSGLCASGGRYDLHAALVLAHLGAIAEFAERCAEAAREHRDPATVTPPPALLLPDADDEQHFAETVGMFVAQAIGALAELEEEVLAVEASDRPADTIAGVRRTMHTLKAEFGVLNMVGPQQLCHQAETTIDACVESGGGFPVDVLLQGIDLLKQFLDRLTHDVRAPFGDVEPVLQKLRDLAAAAQADSEAANGTAPLVELHVGGDFADSLPEFVTEARGHLAEAEAAMVALASEPESLENINLTFRAFHTIKGVAGFLNLNPLVELAHVSETLLDRARSQRLRFRPEDIDLVLAAGDLIQQMLGSLEGRPAPQQRQLARLVASLQAAANRVESSAPVDHQPAAAGTVPAAAASSPAADPVARPAPSASAPAPTAEPGAPTQAAASRTAGAAEPAGDGGDHKAARVERTIKVSTTRLDMLVDMVGELVIAQSMVLQDPAIQRLDSQSLTRNIGQVGKITRDLQEAAMSLRMVTVKATFQKMARLVRDVAQKAGKKVALVISGEDTELDRNVVEQISDPLVHMIRNAIDHGIERPDDRRATGKEGEGHLSLSAYHQGGSIVIEIRDDGRGLDKARIVKKAIEKGLLPADAEARQMADQEVFHIIFLPGFSTAEKVTDLSGRGVGMDVVRRNIEALRGKIEIDSALGVGTTFRLRLPLTLAIIDGMVVRVGNHRYVVPTLSIEQSFRPAKADVHRLVDRGECVSVRGKVLPVHRLKQIFCQPCGLDELEQGILIVVEVDGQRCCLFVDEILGQQQVVIKSLGMPRERVVGLSGGAIMTDGRVALILDVGTLVESAMAG